MSCHSLGTITFIACGRYHKKKKLNIPSYIMRENDHQSYSGTAFRIYIFSYISFLCIWCIYDASLIYDHRAQTHASRFMTSFLIDEISLIIKCSVYAFDEVHFHYIHIYAVGALHFISFMMRKGLFFTIATHRRIYKYILNILRTLLFPEYCTYVYNTIFSININHI